MHAKGDTAINTICCIGAGILGVPNCAVIACEHPDIQVSVVDDDIDVITSWNSDIPPINEVSQINFIICMTVVMISMIYMLFLSKPGFQELLTQCLGRNLVISSDVDRRIAEADIILICVKTPAKSLGIGRVRVDKYFRL